MPEELPPPPLCRRSFLRVLLGAGAALALGGAATTALAQATAPAQRYLVKRGDTLSGIARAHGVSLSQLKQANKLVSDRILAGQRLTIPSATQGNSAAAGTALIAPVIAANRKLKINRNQWRYIVAHHSAIEHGNAAIYGAAHRRRGMSGGLAYHFVIGNGIDSGDGQVEVGPRWEQQLRGGHVRSTKVNDNGIGICLVGNLEKHPPTARQRAAFIQLVDYLRANCVAADCTFTVHKWVDRNHTLCPGKHFPYTEMNRRYRS